MGRGRTTTDPKPYTVAMRLNEDDLRSLDRLAKQWKCSRTDVLRKMLHGESANLSPGPSSAGSPPPKNDRLSLLKIGQRVIVHLRPPIHVEEMNVPGVVYDILRPRKDRPHLPQRYRVSTGIVPCGGGQCDPSEPGTDYWTLPREMLSVAEEAESLTAATCKTKASRNTQTR